MDASMGRGGVLGGVLSCTFSIGRQESVLGLARKSRVADGSREAGPFRVEIAGK